MGHIDRELSPENGHCRNLNGKSNLIYSQVQLHAGIFDHEIRYRTNLTWIACILLEQTSIEHPSPGYHVAGRTSIT